MAWAYWASSIAHSAARKRASFMLSLVGWRSQTSEQLRQLAEIARSLIEGSLEERLTAVIERAPKALGLKSASIFLVRPDFAGFGDRLALPGVEIDASPRPEGITAQVIRTGRVLAVEDTISHPEVHPRVSEAGIRSFLAVPLKSTGGCLGVLYLNQSEPQAFSQDDSGLAEAIGDMVGQAVENARLQESERDARQALEAERQHLAALTAALDRSLAEADLLRAIAVAAARADDLARLLDVTLRLAQGTVAFEGGSVLLREGEQLVVAAATEAGGRRLGDRLRIVGPALRRALEVGEPFIDTGTQPHGGHAVLIAPLRRRSAVFGLLELAAPEGHALDVAALNLSRKIADEIAGWAYILANER